MADENTFRGLAGDLINRFVHPLTFFTAIPILVFWFIFFLLAGMAHSPLVLLFFIPALAYLVGVFTLPAAKGDFDAGFFAGAPPSREVMGFVARFLMLLLLWGIPTLVLAWLLLRGSSDFLFQLPLSSASVLAALGFTGLGMVVVAAVWFFAPTLSIIIAARADSLADVFSLDLWQRLWQERRADLIPFYAGLVGGVVAFYGIYLIPMAIIVTLSFKISPAAGLFVSGFLYSLPAALSPVLMGKMAGAFVFAWRGEVDEVVEDTAGISLLREALRGETYSAAAVAAAAAPQPLVPKPRMEEIVAKVAAATDVAAAIAVAQKSLATAPQDVHAAVELALLRARLERGKETLEAAAAAIRLALANGRGEMAVRLFQEFQPERAELQLEPRNLESLGRLLLGDGAYMAAAWCLHSGAVAAGDALAAQKRLLEVAHGASQDNHPKEAFHLYRFFLQKYPSSNFAQFAATAAEAEERKLKA